MKIAVIGSGISGLYAAWKLSQHHDVTVFEKNRHWGGHTDTHQFYLDGKTVNIDSGFIVFNEYNYPIFCEMLRELGVESQASDMGFSVNNLITGLQYNPSKKFSLLLRPQNFFNSRFRRMLSDLFRFYNENRDVKVDLLSPDLSIADYLHLSGYSDAFAEEHLYPMCGALWSSPLDQVGKIPYKFVVSFFQHHRMLQLQERPQWLTVQGGSSRYIQAIQQQAKQIEFKQERVLSVQRQNNVVQIETQKQHYKYDWVVFASHADDTLALLKDASITEKDVLQKFRYQDNTMVVHHDDSIMPKAKSQWASWHVHVTPSMDTDQVFNTSGVHYGFSYWMNKLQNLPCETQVFATLNPNMPIHHTKVLIERHYRHPIFDQHAISAQKRWQEINGQNRSSFCGAYWGWGFHEDGARSASWVVNDLLKQSSQAA